MIMMARLATVSKRKAFVSRVGGLEETFQILGIAKVKIVEDCSSRVTLVFRSVRVPRSFTN